MPCYRDCELCTGQTKEKLIQSIKEGNLEELKSLLAVNAHLNLLSRSCDSCWDKCSILFDAVQCCKVNSNGCEIVKYILDVGKIDINTTLNKCFLEREIRRPVGAIEPVFADCGLTPLHFVDYSNTTLLLTMLDYGADPNFPDKNNLTPMHRAAKYMVLHTEAIPLMILYGGDVNLVSNDMKTPLMSLLQFADIPPFKFVEDYIFGGLEKVHLDLETLTHFMLKCESSSFFQNVIQNVSKVTFNQKTLEFFLKRLLLCRPKNLKMFIQYRPKIARTIFANEVIVRLLFPHYKDAYWDEVIENLYTLCTIPSVVETIRTNNIDLHALVHALVVISPVDESTLSGILLHLLSDGLITLTNDAILKEVYRLFGDCQLFRTLLHMDIEGSKSKSGYLFPNIIYDMQLNYVEMPSKYVFCEVTKFFAGQKIKNAILAGEDNELKQKALKLPDVPLLLELARNSTRAHIIDFYKVKTSSQFYTILKYLPIYDNCKAIIGFQTPLYKLD